MRELHKKQVPEEVFQLFFAFCDHVKRPPSILLETTVHHTADIPPKPVFFYFYRLSLQVVEDGYEFFAKRQLVTLFSAPNYCGEFDNAGAMMSVDETLMCSFQVKFLSLLCTAVVESCSVEQ